MFQLSPFSYHLFSAKNALFPHEREFSNQVFIAWQRLWSEVYGAKNYKLETTDFLRQDVIATLMYEGQVAAVHLYSLFDIQCLASLGSHYFEFFNDEYFRKLSEREVRLTMSMEYLSVMPPFRKKNTGFSVATLLIALGNRVADELGVDAVVAPARNDVGVNKMAYDVGFKCLVPSTIQRGFECDLIARFRGESANPSDEIAAGLVSSLWQGQTRHDSALSVFSNAIRHSNTKLRVA